MGGIQNEEGFWLKIDCSQIKLPNLEYWNSGELSKCQNFYFQSQFSMSKSIRIFLNFFSLKNTNLGALLWTFLIKLIFKSLYC